MSKVFTVLSLVLFIFGPIGEITAGFAEPLLPKPRPLGGEFRAVRPDNLVASSDVQPVIAEPSETLNLQQALALALMNNPELTAFSWEVRARDAAVLQAGFLPNPELRLEIENFAGSGSLRGTDQAESTLSLAQRLETAGKRKKREKVAALNRALAGWDYESARLHLFSGVSKAFIDVLGDQEKSALAKELLALAAQVAETVTQRVEAGKVSPVEAIKAGVALSSAKIDLSRAEKELIASRKALAAMWGSAEAQFKTAAGALSPPASLPSFEQVAERLSQNPALARWDTELSQGLAVIDLERANAIPDVSIGGGFRQFSQTGDSALVAGISMDLPVFNRNQGGIRSANARHSKALAARHAAALRLRTALAQAYRFLSAAFSELEGLKNNLLPGAEKAFEAVSEGYRLGKFALLDVLDAQRTLSHARAQYLQTQIDYQKAAADVEGLIGEKLKVGQVINRPDTKESHHGK